MPEVQKELPLGPDDPHWLNERSKLWADSMAPKSVAYDSIRLWYDGLTKENCCWAAYAACARRCCDIRGVDPALTNDELALVRKAMRENHSPWGASRIIRDSRA